MRIIIIILVMIAPMALQSQPSIERTVIGSAGGYSEAGNVSLSYTVGETCVKTRTHASIVLTEGFQQAGNEPVSVDFSEVGAGIKVFPNPTADKLILQLNTGGNTENDFIFEIIDIRGRKLFSASRRGVSGEYIEEFDFSTYSSGMYYIIIRSKEYIKRIKVEKLD